MKIPVFVSCLTVLTTEQNNSREIVLSQLNGLGLEPRALGRSDLPTKNPLREVYVHMRHCAGGIILGFRQFIADSGTWQPGTIEEIQTAEPVSFPTPWNHLEAGVMFSQHLPTLIFKEDGISGGVFDAGAMDAFVHKMPSTDMTDSERKALSSIFFKWSAEVRENFYSVD